MGKRRRQRRSFTREFKAGAVKVVQQSGKSVPVVAQELDLTETMPTFTVSSELSIPPDEFWSRMSMSAVNSELWPLVRMTSPGEWRQCALEQWATGRILFRSVVLLFGFLPVDVHSLRLERIEPGRGFLERSHSWANRLWQHERTTSATPRGCIVTDTVSVHGRAPLVTSLLLPAYRFVFRHRHNRLAARYGHARG